MSFAALCQEVLHDMSRLHLSRQIDQDCTISSSQINPIAAKADRLFREAKIAGRQADETIFEQLASPLAQEIVRQNVQELDILISKTAEQETLNASLPSQTEILEGKKIWFSRTPKSAWSLLAAVLDLKITPDKKKLALFHKLTRIWDEFYRP